MRLPGFSLITAETEIRHTDYRIDNIDICIQLNASEYEKENRMMMKCAYRLASPFLLSCLLLLGGLGGCAKTQQMHEPLKTGFLEDYSMLRPGQEGEALLVYKKPKVNWKLYDKAMVDSVTIWREKNSPLKEEWEADLQRLADYFWDKVVKALMPNYKIVNKPGPGVMRVTVAITEAEASNPTMDTISSVLPPTRLLTGAKGVVGGGKPGFVGAASVEAKITDAQTGELLMAGVDRRAGTKSLSGSTNSWSDVEEAYQYWAKKLKYRLCRERGEMGCIKPEE